MRRWGGLVVSAGVGNRLQVQPDEALAAVARHMTELRAEAEKATVEEKVSWDWKSVVKLNYCVEASALLSMLDVSARIFACRFYAPKEGATKLSCGWALGYYHALAQNDLVELKSNVIPVGTEMKKYDEGGKGPRRGRRISSVVPLALRDGGDGPPPEILQVARRRSMTASFKDVAGEAMGNLAYATLMEAEVEAGEVEEGGVGVGADGGLLKGLLNKTVEDSRARVEVPTVELAAMLSEIALEEEGGGTV